MTAADAVGGTRRPIPLGTEADVYCYGYIGDPNEPMPNSSRRTKTSRAMYDPGAVRQAHRRLGRRSRDPRRRHRHRPRRRRDVPRRRAGELVYHPGDTHAVVGRQYQLHRADRDPLRGRPPRARHHHAVLPRHSRRRAAQADAAAPHSARAHPGHAGVLRSVRAASATATSSTRRADGTTRSARASSSQINLGQRRPAPAGRLPHRLPREHRSRASHGRFSARSAS